MDERRLDVLRLERLVQQVRKARRQQPLQEPLVVRAPNPTEKLGERGRRPESVRIHDGCRARPEGVPAGVGGSIELRERADRLDVARFVAVQDQVTPIWKRPELERIEIIDLESVPAEIEIPDDRRLQRVTQERTARESEARDQLLGRTRPADDPAALHHQDVKSAPSQVGRRDQPVVARPHDDRVTLRHAATMVVSVRLGVGRTAKPATARGDGQPS